MKEDNSSKFTGVTWDKKNNKWKASIVIDGESKTIGYFDNEQEASAEYKRARTKLMEESDKFYKDNYKNKDIKE